MEADATRRPSTAFLGALLLLPAAALAWPGPGAPLLDDPYPHLAASAIALMLAVPAALRLPFVPGNRPRGLLLWTTPWALVALAVGFGAPVDGFEARRTLAHFTALSVAFLGGAHLGFRGREVFLRGLVVLSLVWTGGAFVLDVLGAEHLAGVLGDTGSLSQAALPGAVIGVWFLALRDGLWRTLGLGAVLGTIAHASVAPVIGAGGALVATLVACALLSPWAHERTRVRRRFGVCAAVAVFALIAMRGLPRGTTDEPVTEAGVAAPDLGGVAVRVGIWKRVPALLGSAPVLGVGPGQFQASFPPFRDPREIELSRHGICAEGTTEVEHAHNDYLEGLAELGLVGGAFWLAFLGLAATAAVRHLREKDVLLAATAAAALALLVNGLFHAPLTFNAAAAFPGFVLFGILLAGPEGSGAQRLLRIEVALAALLAVPAFAWPAVVHGRSLAGFARSVRDGVSAEDRPDYLGRAFEAVPDSAPVRQILYALPMMLLEVRPHSVQGHEAMGLLAVRSGARDQARLHLERALELSPTHPRILRNLVRFEYEEGELERGAAYLEQLQSQGCLGADWPGELGEELVVDGLLEAGARLLFGVPVAELIPEQLNADAQALEETDVERARALRTLAHVLWARGHVDRGDHATAVRSYRQAWNASRGGGRPGAGSVRLELHAAEVLEGREPSEPDLRSWSGESGWQELPTWASEALTGAGCTPGGQG